LFEELLVGDNVVGTIHPMIMRAEEQMIPWKQLAPAVTVLDKACRNFDPVWKSMEEKIGKEARKTPMRLLFKKI
jgi:FlaA1/EpsC-like NDP-sugar epimerase